MSKRTQKILSCFVDESGDFGEYDPRCPYYMVTAVLHDQSISIDKQLRGIEEYCQILATCIMLYMQDHLLEESLIMRT